MSTPKRFKVTVTRNGEFLGEGQFWPGVGLQFPIDLLEGDEVLHRMIEGAARFLHSEQAAVSANLHGGYTVELDKTERPSRRKAS